MSVEEDTEFGIVFSGEGVKCPVKLAVSGVTVTTELVLGSRNALRAMSQLLCGLDGTHLWAFARLGSTGCAQILKCSRT